MDEKNNIYTVEQHLAFFFLHLPLSEVKIAVKLLKKGKALEKHSITSEFLKQVRNIPRMDLHLINEIWREKLIPK